MKYLYFNGYALPINEIDRILKYERKDKDFPYAIKIQTTSGETADFIFIEEEDRNNGYDEIMYELNEYFGLRD